MIDALKRQCKKFKRGIHLMQTHSWILNPCFEEACVLAGSKATALKLRLVIGEYAERYCVSKSSELAQPCSSWEVLDEEQKGELCQLYFDAFAISVWTSVHAEALAMHLKQPEMDIEPNIFLVPNALTTLDLSILYERKFSQHSLPKSCTSVLQMITRCTNPGARGWEPVVANMLRSSVAKRILCKELIVCLSGLHPQLHPALRPDWKTRMIISQSTEIFLSTEDSNSDLNKASNYIKEVCRRLVASIMSGSMAMHASLSSMSHPCRHLTQPPMDFPARSFEASMAAFADTGSKIATRTMPGRLDLYNLLHESFQEAQESNSRLSWTTGWLGKGTVNVNSNPTAIDFCEAVTIKSFKSKFTPFWLHAYSKNIRVLRLDHVQHEAINVMTTCWKMTSKLSLEDQLCIQRIVMRTPGACLMSIRDALQVLGYDVETWKSIVSIKDIRHVLIRIASSFGSYAIARLLFFSKVAWLSDQVSVVDLGQETKRINCECVLKRMKRDVPPDAMNGTDGTDGTDELEAYVIRNLPSHCHSLCICTECGRVSNACVTSSVGDEKKIYLFNELGLSQSMVQYKSIDGGHACLFCAKRSSAALRSNQNFEQDMMERKVELEELDVGEITDVIVRKFDTSDCALGSKLRRDSKNALVQRLVSNSCGTFEMLKVPLLGKAVRIYGQFYTMCGFCASFVCVKDVHRYGDQICCLRCDNTMFAKEEPKTEASFLSSSGAEKKLCRYCGAVDPERSGIRWKQIKSPLDSAGENASLPPPLRKCYYCPTHYRPWLLQAHRVLETKVIIAHISTNAKPVIYGDDNELKLEHKKKKKGAYGGRKRKRMNGAGDVNGAGGAGGAGDGV